MFDISQMTVKELKEINIPSVKFGRNLAEQLQVERACILRQMADTPNNEVWKKLADRRYDLHRLRIQVLLDIGQMVAGRMKIAGGK